MASTGAGVRVQGPRRADRVTRYKQPTEKLVGEDSIPEYMNLLAMVFSICGLMMKVKGPRSLDNATGHLRSTNVVSMWSRDYVPVARASISFKINHCSSI
jgi:hypothetical protein